MHLWIGLSDLVSKFWETTAEMAPYLLLGFALAGILSVAVRPASVQKHLNGRGLWPVIKATLIGVPLPLCSCGVIPLAASLRRQGASRGATAAFLISTPQTGVDSISVTYSLMGPFISVFRPLAALVTGVIGGYVVQTFGGPEEDFNETAEPKESAACADDAACAEGACAVVQQDSWLKRMLTYSLVTLPRDIGGAVLGGLIVAGLIAALVPDDFFANYLANRWLAMLIMLAVGMPLYVCATGSVPIAAALVAKGIAPGAAFIFLVAGPGTNAAAITTLWRVLGKRSTLLYLIVVGSGAFLFGALIDTFMPSAVALHIPAYHSHHQAGVPLWKSISAAVLMILLLWSLIDRIPRSRTSVLKKELGGMPDAVFKVSGMTCSSCRSSVAQAALACPGVKAVYVDLAAGAAFIRGEGFDHELIMRQVRERGFEIREEKTS